MIIVRLWRAASVQQVGFRLVVLLLCVGRRNFVLDIDCRAVGIMMRGDGFVWSVSGTSGRGNLRLDGIGMRKIGRLVHRVVDVGRRVFSAG